MPRSETPHQPRIRLSDARSSRGFSQQEVAERIGTTYVNVSRWERGITKPSPYFRRKLCTLFGKTEEELDLLPPSSKVLSSSKEKTTVAPPPPTTSHQPVNQPTYDPAIPLLPAIKLIGREHDIARIKHQLITKGNVALTALNGLPGVGKTALSITLAHDAEIRAHFKDGVLWAGLGPTPNMAGLFSRWGTLLGISANQMATLTDNEAWAKAIRAAIGSRSMLLVIDDTWKFEDVQTVRVGGPHCAHLVTTRFPNIAAYVAVGGPTIIKELNPDDSLKLLGTLAPQVINHEAQKAHDLVQAVGGLPLALTLMGNYLRKQAYSGPARRITAAMERLNNVETRLTIQEPHVPAESHPSLPVETSLSLQSVIAVTDQLLAEQPRAALYALSVFPPKPNTFSEEAALAITAYGYEELDTLSDTGLLENSGSRYLLHQTIADYARLKLKESGSQAPYTRLIAYVVDYVEQHKKEYELLELESSTIQTAIEFAHTLKQPDNLVHIVCAFAPFLILRGFYTQAETYLKLAHEAATTQGNDDGVTRTLLYLGQITQKQGNFAQAETYFQEGLELARRSNNQDLVCALLTGLGSVRWRRGDYNHAETYLQEGLQLARQLNDKEHISGLLRILGSVIASRGNFTQAKIYFQEGLQISKQIGNREQTCVLLGNLGAAEGMLGNYKQTKAYLEEGLVLARQLGDLERICVLLINLGEVSKDLEDYQHAEAYFQEGLQLARKLEHREWIGALLNNLGQMKQLQGQYYQSELYLKESLTLAKQIGKPQITANALYQCGNLYLKQNKIDLAKSTFEEMLTTIPQGSKELPALANYGLARVFAHQGDFTQAKQLGKQSSNELASIHHGKYQEVSMWLNSIEEKN